MGPFHSSAIAGLQHTINMDGRDEFNEDSECHSHNSQEFPEQDSVSEDSDSDLDRRGDDSSSNASADDHMTTKRTQCRLQGAGVKEESDDGTDRSNNFVCPLCTLEFSSPEKLISHVYQHTTIMSSTKSYVCPVCGRALSSPGSLGRHLLIHSEDRLSNCAVCGTHFTDTNNFNREKLKELLNTSPSLPSIPDSLTSSSSSSSLPPIPDILSPMPVYPAGVLLVCNSCVAYQQLMGSQSPMRKWALRRKNEPLEARMQRLERERTAKKTKRACETDEEREMRRLRDREAKRMQRLQETEEQRARRLQRDREAMRLKRANETPEKRQARLIREREAKRIKRRLEKIDPSLRTQIEHDPAAMAALTADMSLFQFPCPMPVPSIDNSLFMKLP
ncbi:zinc finger protein 821 [Lampris incognitus]|uniref:zinc finger protein 821 n=1 Tax=Lampris incognitus TaxID=2546036 RepID=UPI0024B5C075|nr:zinc finger protein 821 [Lampris incognitus]